MSRTKKKAYTKGKRVAKSCRNHGGCPWCQGNRHHKTKKRIISTTQDLKENQ